MRIKYDGDKEALAAIVIYTAFSPLADDKGRRYEELLNQYRDFLRSGNQEQAKKTLELLKSEFPNARKS